MDVYNKRRLEQQIPAFGCWESYEGIPFTSYLESANQRVFHHYSYSSDSDLYHCTYSDATPFQTSQRIAGREKSSIERWADADDLKGFPTMRAARMPRPNPKPVDEDLYQIPVQLVCPKSKRKKRGPGFFTRWLLPVICF